ncbi:unnamed protein product [Rotaria socialis]|uniref:Ubiquitin-specific peptidase-like SUMO isopeptidase domain-containing protein n=1 Tax=Rotaria socialis TaxID=392032 RepID=A0A817UED6_9BILA|nr:unnamed protein product [Rotaria socialis]CAF3338287.1 unnamed protein product [Rotaria socialis]CAF4324447.1 unnamed protein product [Rotaria socialis]CAF4352538.1 unnamed protein product [Rotaria socialis]
MATSENIWSTFITTRQISSNYYTISTCLTDLLHRCSLNSTLFYNLSQTLFSSSSIDQIKLLNDYSNIIKTILKQNPLHTNILQNIRRLFRSDPCLKELFSTIVDEHCQCQQCGCTILNSITDVIHDVDEIKSTLFIESNQISCTCFRCNDPNQLKTSSFKKLSPCLALTVNRLHINVNDRFIHTQGVTYDMIYIIEFDVTLHSILNVYQRQDIDFMIVDGNDISSRRSTIDSHGKFLTLWMSRKCYQLDLTLDSDKLMPSQSTNSNSFDELESVSPATTASEGTSDDNDTTTSIYLTLFQSKLEHDHTVNSLALHNRSLEQLSPTRKSKRMEPYTTA